MPGRSTPHNIVDYRNDVLHESNLVDDDHYISLRLHNDGDYPDEEDDEHIFDPPPSRHILNGIHRLEPEPVSVIPSTHDQFLGLRQHQGGGTMSSEYERFDIRAPIWGPNKRESIILSACGALSIIAGVLCCLCGAFDFVAESYAGEAAFQVESKFGMLVLVFSGLASCKAASRIRATSIACLFGFSLMAVGSALCDSCMQFLNLYFVRDPLERGIDVAIMLFSLIGALTSMAQVVVALIITSTAIERAQWSQIDTGGSSAVVKQKAAGVVLGLVQSLCGAVITGITIGIYAVLDGKGDEAMTMASGVNGTRNNYTAWSLDVKWTLSSEMTNHGFLIAAAGISVAISSLHWTRWTQLVSLSLQGATLITTASNHVHALAIIYQAPSFAGRDIKLALVQLLAYFFVLIIAAFSFLNSLKRLSNNTSIGSGSGSSSSRSDSNQQALNTAIKELAEKRGWKLFLHTAVIQLCLASLYLIVWVAGFGEKFLYLLDFTPLPVLILLHTVLSYALTLTYSAFLLLLNVAWVFFVGLYAVRDLYLFDYHAASKVPQDQVLTPRYFNESFMAAIPMVSRLGVHLLLAAVALMETILAVVLILMYLRTLGETMGIVIPNKLQHKHTLRALSAIGGLQLVSAALIINFSFILFLSNLFTAEYMGDACIMIGLLSLGTGICTFLTARASAVFLPLAAIMNALAFVVLWQQTDAIGLMFSRIILYYKDHENPEQHRAFVFGAITFALCLFSQTLNGLSLIGLEDVLIDAKFDSCVRVEMLVQNAGGNTMESMDLVQDANA